MQDPTPDLSYPEIEQRTFDFIDAMPGSGKTEYFVNKAVSLLNNKAATINLMYAAPTVRLLTEALTRIHAHPSFNKKTRRKIILIASSNKLQDVSSLCTVHQERPVKVVNHILGLRDEGLDVEPLGVGHILMVTHECFVQVASKDTTGKDFEVLKRTSVVFDEARQCVIDSRTTKDLSYGDLAIMSRLFRFKRQTIEKDRSLGWFVYEVQRAPSHKKLLEGFGTTRVRAIPNSVHRLRDEVSRYSDTGRSKVYFMTNMSDAHTFLDEDERHATAVVTTLLRPTSLFNNYRDVTLTSAFFTDSQLYHFLKQDGHKFRNLAKTNPASVAAILHRDSLLRQQLPKRLRVAPLMVAPVNNKTSDHYKNTLTANLLENGMVVPATLKPESVRKGLVKNFSSTELLETLHNNGKISTNPKVQKLLKQFFVPPLWVLINECAHVIRSAPVREMLNTDTNPSASDCLLVFNVKSRYWRSTVPASSVVRSIYSNGNIRLSQNTSEEIDLRSDGDTQRQALLAACPREWEQRLSKYLYSKSKDSLFIIAPSTKMHGINKYRKVNVFAHIAALNPAPPMIALYRALLGEGYDVDQDHAIENLVQMLYRTSLRDPSAETKVLMIVPYAAYATMLQQKIGCSSFVSVHSPRLTPWLYSKTEDVEVRAANGRKGGLRAAANRTSSFTQKQKTQRNSLLVMKSRYSKYLRERPADVKAPYWATRIRELSAQLNAMIKPKYDL